MFSNTFARAAFVPVFIAMHFGGGGAVRLLLIRSPYPRPARLADSILSTIVLPGGERVWL
jgi:hypothetical protein